MRLWIISDTHFGHSNILKHCRRPADADQKIIKNWKALVKPEDEVLHLGDVCWGFYKLEDLLPTLPGIKTLVVGNHDTKTKTYYAKAGFAGVWDSVILNQIYYTHKPAEKRPPGCRVNVHGHLHNRYPKGFRMYAHSRLFSVEEWEYRPWLVDKFLKKEAYYFKELCSKGGGKGYRESFVERVMA